MDKNIIALLREDTKTVKVRFFPDSWTKPENLDASLFDLAKNSANLKQYTYVTTLDLNPGDLVVVYVGAVPKIVEVQEVDTDLAIEPNESTCYKWIAAKVDMAYYEDLTQKNSEFTALLRDEYQARTRRQFRSIFLADAPKELADKFSGLGEKK